MNLVEKVIARASGRSRVSPGELVVADVDRAIFHDLSFHTTCGIYAREDCGELSEPESIAVVFDHIFSPPDEHKAQVLADNRNFARTHGTRVHDVGSGNIHCVAMTRGEVAPGQLIVGSDSHSPVHGALGAVSLWVGNYSAAGTVFPEMKVWLKVPELIDVELVGTCGRGTTARDVALQLVREIGEGNAKYAAIRFKGEFVETLGFWDRWLLTLMAIDVGAKCAFVDPDAETERAAREFGVSLDSMVTSDLGTVAETSYRLDVSELEPVVVPSPSLSNAMSVSELAPHPIQWAELGGHGGGRTEDFRLAAQILAGQKVSDRVGLNMVPSARSFFTESLDGGFVETTHASGANWFPASSGANQALNMGAMAAGESMVSTQSRNFPGRNGSRDSQMVLASALTVAASSVRGELTDPREFL